MMFSLLEVVSEKVGFFVVSIGFVFSAYSLLNFFLKRRSLNRLLLGLRSNRSRNASRRVLVTGASSGIGRAVVLYLCNVAGFTVIATVRKKEDAESLELQVEQRELLFCFQMEVTDENSVAQTFERIVSDVCDDGKGLDGLFCNAGIATSPDSSHRAVELSSFEGFHTVMEVNFFGTLRTIQTFLPLLRAGHGCIILNSSVAGITTTPFSGAYSASKHAVEALGDALRRECIVSENHVRVVILECGAIYTPLFAKRLHYLSPANLDQANLNEEDPFIAIPSPPASHSDLSLLSKIQNTFVLAKLCNPAFENRNSATYDPACVAERVLEVLLMESPPTRTAVGGGTTVALLMDWLPDALLDWVVKRLTKRLYASRKRVAETTRRLLKEAVPEDFPSL